MDIFGSYERESKQYISSREPESWNLIQLLWDNSFLFSVDECNMYLLLESKYAVVALWGC